MIYFHILVHEASHDNRLVALETRNAAKCYEQGNLAEMYPRRRWSRGHRKVRDVSEDICGTRDEMAPFTA